MYLVLGPISVCHQLQEFPRQLEYPDSSLAQKVKTLFAVSSCTLLGLCGSKPWLWTEAEILA